MPRGDPGSYLLLLRLDEARLISVGKLGAFHFPSGWYVYAGSALAGLEARVSRHLRRSGVRHWHLDYLREEVSGLEALPFPGPGRRECDLAGLLLAQPGAFVPAPGFGASDCRCRTHLVGFSQRPDLSQLSSSTFPRD